MSCRHGFVSFRMPGTDQDWCAREYRRLRLIKSTKIELQFHQLVCKNHLLIFAFQRDGRAISPERARGPRPPCRPQSGTLGPDCYGRSSSECAKVNRYRQGRNRWPGLARGRRRILMPRCRSGAPGGSGGCVKQAAVPIRIGPVTFDSARARIERSQWRHESTSERIHTD